jgi:hypothetical protein
MTERLLVKIGHEWMNHRMTRDEAQRHGERHMSPAYKEAGCKVVVSDHRTRDGDWYRIEYEPTEDHDETVLNSLRNPDAISATVAIRALLDGQHSLCLRLVGPLVGEIEDKVRAILRFYNVD